MNLIKLDQVENLSFDQIKNIFKKNINKSKTDFLTSFSFGRDKIKYAEGIKIYNEKDEAILDFTAGVGVLSHGHNHPRILKVRKFYQETKKMEVNKSFLSPYLAALSHIRDISNMSLFDQALLTEDNTYVARIRAFLDTESLPPPMRPQSYFSSNWDMSSEWYRWELVR